MPYLGVSADAAQEARGLVDDLSGVTDPEAGRNVLDVYDKATVDTRTNAGNYLINGAFQIWERATSFSPVVATGNYLVDRWRFVGDAISAGSATINVTQESFALGQTDVDGNPPYYFRYDQTVAGAGATSSAIQQLIVEHGGVSLLHGQVVTVSLWAKAEAAHDIYVILKQTFGTGGSPSVDIAYPSDPISITTSWQKYTFTTTLTSVFGKTVGSNNDDDLRLSITFPLNVTSTIDLAMIKLEPGDAATELVLNSAVDELRSCQRYYETVVATGNRNNTGALATVDTAVQFKVLKRVTPSVVTVSYGAVEQSNESGVVAYYGSVSSGDVYDPTITADSEVH